MSKELATELVASGFAVFPVNHTKENEKKPLTEHGHLDASREQADVDRWWALHPHAKVGVPAGINGLVIADVDTKHGKDGWASLDQAGIVPDETFAYDTGTGGRHLVYAAPEGVELTGNANYDGLDGFDRRAGSSWVMWVADEVPMLWDLAPAPEWLCKVAEPRAKHHFEGSLAEWFEGLTPGEPNALVRRAIDRIEPDMSHSTMIERQHEAIRLGAEGNSGVPELLEAIREAWENRPAENHGTPESEWSFKFEEALVSGLEKYGETTELMKNLPKYDLSTIPTSVPDNLIVGTNEGNVGFSRTLGALVENIQSDDQVASILWNAPATKDTARDWGIHFVFKRITDARKRPEPTRENPRIEEELERVREVGTSDFSLLTEEEREYLEGRHNYIDRVVNTAEQMSYDQKPYFRSVGWLTMSMAFSFKGFIPLSPTHKLGTNLWFILPGGSGSGKSVTGSFSKQILDLIFSGDGDDIVPYDLGDDSSPQGLHAALIERDRMGSLFSSDEATGFFESLGLKDWRASIAERITSWYNGFVQGSNKLSQKELRGRSAMTNLCMHMFGTPEKLANSIHAEMFESGFMARVIWVFGNPPRNDSSRFKISIDTSNESAVFDEVPKPLREHATDLVAAVIHRENPAPILPGPGVEDLLSRTYERMYRMSEGRENWHLVEPSLTRLSESMMKMTMLGAMYRNDTVMQVEDALHAIGAMEEFFANLHRMAALISSGQFQRRADEIENWIRGKGGKVSRAAIFHRFRDFIERDSREIDNLLTYLMESGTLNRKEENNSVRYEING